MNLLLLNPGQRVRIAGKPGRIVGWDDEWVYVDCGGGAEKVDPRAVEVEKSK